MQDTVVERLLSDLGRVIAHRGASGEAPENTLEAMRLAASQGARWLEVDAMVTADGRAVLHHDNHLDRCTNGSGYLLAHSYDQVAKLDAGSWFAPQYSGARIPTVEALLDLVDELSLGLNVELKPVSGWEEPTAEIVCATLRQNWQQRTPLLLSSFSQESLKVARRMLPNVARGYVANVVPPNWPERMDVADCASLHCHHYQLLTASTAAAVKAAGKVLLCFTVNHADDAARLMSWGVDAVFSDYPARIIERVGA
jgi:glycerophosphoryl diester phosphodiesterase